MDFTSKKCHVMKLGKSKRIPAWGYEMREEIIPKTEEEKNLRVVIEDTLSPEWHTSTIFESTYKMLSILRMAFHYMGKNMMEKNYSYFATSQAGTCSSGVVATYEERHQKVRRDSGDS